VDEMSSSVDMITITKSGLPNQESMLSALRFCVASPKRRGPSLPHSIETSVVHHKQIEKLSPPPPHLLAPAMRSQCCLARISKQTVKVNSQLGHALVQARC
jgi:hypothetical protein